MEDVRRKREDSLPAQYFRAGAGAVIINEAGLVLALERADLPGAWQLPQGGLDEKEEPLETAYREASEETGIPGKKLELLDSLPEPLAYELPFGLRTGKTGRGQVQYWFLFRFNSSDEAIDILGGGEFRAWQWMPFSKLTESVAEFRRPIYLRLAERFKAYLSPL
ncbi:MAG: RNA pyrophosphohydrolase [Thermodesulfovibrionales bacterium]|jgi:putative (di)nucleoside polyphosphate hydrolase